MLKNRPIGGGGSGEGVDMNALYNIFASKSPPDNTIKRIEALEKQVASMSKVDEDLTKRVVALEAFCDDTDHVIHEQHDKVFALLDKRIKKLEAAEAPVMPNMTGDIDTAAILKQVNLVKTELSQVRTDLSKFSQKTTADLEGLRIELRGYTDKEVSDLKSMMNKKVNDVAENLKFEIERLRAEFENFKNKDFKDVEARVTALEKKFLKLQEMLANMKIPEASGGSGVSQEDFDALELRVRALENDLAMFKAQFSQWCKEI